jgi:hypothetical protein
MVTARAARPAATSRQGALRDTRRGFEAGAATRVGTCPSSRSFWDFFRASRI